MTRRIVATPRRIAETIEAVKQSSGLTPKAVSHYPDGRTVVHFEGMEFAEVEQASGQGWEDV